MHGQSMPCILHRIDLFLDGMDAHFLHCSKCICAFISVIRILKRIGLMCDHGHIRYFNQSILSAK